MVKKETLNILSTYIKSPSAYASFDTDQSKLTANNYNYIISAIFEIAETSVIAHDLLSGSLNNKYTDLAMDIGYVSALLDRQISNILNSQGSVEFASTALSSDYALTADYAKATLSARHADQSDIADNALKVTLLIRFYVNLNLNNNIITYDGSEERTINTILSAIHALSAVNAELADDALSASEAFHCSLAVSAELAFRVTNALQWMSALLLDIGIYDGSLSKTISSVLFSVHSQLSLLSQYAVSADFDSDEIPLNTKVEYVFSEDENYDYPILFAEELATKVLSNEKYKVKYHLQININPYLGAIKANYFIGTAISATYAVCDTKSNMLNTRVCQNSTENNYNYPIALSFINSQGNPVDGLNNELLYTYKMRINPYNDIIFTKQVPTTAELALADIDYSIYKGTNGRKGSWTIGDNTYLHTYVSHEQYSINLVGLATRALYDLSGYPLNESTITYKDEASCWKPIIACTSSRFNINNPGASLPTSTHDKLTYSKNIIINPSGDLRLSGQILADGNITTNSYIKTNSYLSAAGSITCGTGLTAGTTALQVEKNGIIKGTLTVNGQTTLNNNLTVVSSATINQQLTVLSSAQFNNTVNISKQLNVGGKIDGNSTIYATSSITTDSFIKATGDISGKNIRAVDNMYCKKMYGTATSAQWADLAEKYETDIEYPIGTLICFGGLKEITIATNEVNGVISLKPAYLMNCDSIGQPIALIGRVRVRVIGPVNKFDYIGLSDIPGIGTSIGKNKILKTNAIGRALANKTTINLLLILCIIKLEL